MLAYTLRKHAGVRSYVLPMDLYDSETWGNVDVDWNMQHQVRETLFVFHKSCHSFSFFQSRGYRQQGMGLSSLYRRRIFGMRRQQ